MEARRAMLVIGSIVISKGSVVIEKIIIQ